MFIKTTRGLKLIYFISESRVTGDEIAFIMDSEGLSISNIEKLNINIKYAIASINLYKNYNFSHISSNKKLKTYNNNLIKIL